ISSQKQRIPKELDWDLWLGPAAMRDYNEAYLPFKWRGFWDFGTGALGDMGCHIMETPFSVLDLGYPKEAEASCTTVWVDDFVEADYSHSCPPSSKIHLKFEHETHEEIALNWYDGGIKPDLPDELKDGENIGNVDGGTVIYGDKGILICDTYSRNARLLPSEMMDLYKAPAAKYPRVPGSMEGHIANFVDGCLTGVPTSSNFDKAGRLTETVLMGNLAVQAYQYKELKPGKKATDWDPYHSPGKRKLWWDGETMRSTTYEKANDWVSREYRQGSELKSLLPQDECQKAPRSGPFCVTQPHWGSEQPQLSPFMALVEFMVQRGKHFVPKVLFSGQSRHFLELPGQGTRAPVPMSVPAFVESPPVQFLDLVQYLFRPIGQGLFDPVGKQLPDGTVEPDHGHPKGKGTGIGYRPGHGQQFMTVDARDDGGQHGIDRNIVPGKLLNGTQSLMDGSRPGLQDPSGPLRKGGDRNVHPDQAVGSQFPQQIEIPQYQGILGDDPHRMPVPEEDFQTFA